MLRENGEIQCLDITGSTEREEPECLKCEGCGHIYPTSSINLDGLCVGCERRAKRYDIFQIENAPLVKPTGKCVVVDGWKV